MHNVEQSEKKGPLLQQIGRQRVILLIMHQDTTGNEFVNSVGEDKQCLSQYQQPNSPIIYNKKLQTRKEMGTKGSEL